MKLFDIALFIVLLFIAVMLCAFSLIGSFGLIVLLVIAVVGFLPFRIMQIRRLNLRLLLQRIAGKTQR